MPKNHTTARRPSGTLDPLCKALNLSKRQVSTLLSQGMPVDPTAAVEWHKRRRDAGDNSSEALRAEKIGLTRAQRLKVELETATRRGELVPVGEVLAAGLSVAAATRSALLQLASDLPPRLEGLTAAKIGRVLRESHVRILNELSQGKWMDSPEVAAIIESARLEVKGK